MPRKPKFRVSKVGSFVSIPVMVFRRGRGRAEGALVDEVYYDRKAFLGRGGFKSMYGPGRAVKFGRKK